MTNPQILTAAWLTLELLVFLPAHHHPHPRPRPSLMWILSIWLVFKFRLIKRFWVNRIWQTRSFLRRVLGDTDGGLETGKTELICYVCSFGGLEISVNHSSGENPARCVCGKTNLVSSVHGLARTSHVMDALWGAPCDLEWASRISRFLHYVCVCPSVCPFSIFLSEGNKTHFSLDLLHRKLSNLNLYSEIPLKARMFTEVPLWNSGEIHVSLTFTWKKTIHQPRWP